MLVRSVSYALVKWVLLRWLGSIKDEDASIGTEMKEEDFRVITGNPVVAQGSLNFFHRVGAPSIAA